MLYNDDTACHGDVPTLKGHVAPMKPLCGYRSFGWRLSEVLNSLGADSGTGYGEQQQQNGHTLESEAEEAWRVP